MPGLMRNPVGLPLQHKLLLGLTSAILAALLQGCAADKNPSQA